jgi:hypothetical protein
VVFLTFATVFTSEGTDVKTEYRGVDRFSKHYVPSQPANPSTEGEKEA